MEEENWDEPSSYKSSGIQTQYYHSSNQGQRSYRDDRSHGYQEQASNWRSRQESDHDYQRDERPRRGGYGGESYQQDGRRNVQVINVPSQEVGKIIGRGGAKIKELQSTSGARIKVNRDDDGNGETSIELQGTEEQRQKAEELIKNITEQQASYGSSKMSSNSNQQESSFQMIDWRALLERSSEISKKRWENAPPIKKNFYVEDPEITMMHPEEVKEFRAAQNNITVSHHNPEDRRSIPNPVMKFEHAFSSYPEIMEAINSQGFTVPSPIQCQAWPVLLKGYDMIGIAQTGTGKTLAFLLPALIHIEGQTVPRDQRDGPTVLIMAPTRELAQQIDREVKKFPYRDVKCVCVYGGGNRREQMSVVSKGVEIVVATPGRLFDLMEAGCLKMSSVTYVVLDEADRMLDLGFEPQIKKIFLDVRPDRQTVMTSATWPEGVRRIAKDYMDDPIQVCIGTLDLAAVNSVTQYIEIIDEEEKRPRLLDFIASMGPNDKAIVFVGRKATADQIASDLTLEGISCQCIHGSREQMDREQALADLRSGDVRILIATDVASRGIDISDVTHILNYDFPRHAEEYVHRVGRTGRAGRTGVALSWMTREDWSRAEDLIGILQQSGQEIPEELYQMADRFTAFKERKEEERRRLALDSGGGGGGRRGGGRGGGGGFGGGRRGGRGRYDEFSGFDF